MLDKLHPPASPSAHLPTGRYLLGPDSRGRWSVASVLSIKHKEVSVSGAQAGPPATFL